MENICRTCLGSPDKKFVNIFEHFRNNKLISDTIMECINIKVHKSDSLPINICSSCLEKLNAAYDFRISVIESDIKLRNCGNMAKNSFKENHKFLSNNAPLIKGENLNCENYIPCTNKYEIDGEKIEAHGPLANHKDSITIDNICKEEYSYEMKENVIKQKFFSDLHNNGISTHSDNTFDNDDNSEKFTLIANEGDKNSMHESEKSNLVVDEDELSLSTINKSRKTVFCKECNRSFGYCYFKIHVRNHNGDRPFKCDICNKGFAKEFLLKTHKATHSDKKPYSCDVCGKGFKNLIALRGHILRHQKDRPFICEVCGKGFVDGAGLATHKVAHRTEKNYACSICGKTFLSRSRLTRHTKKHSDDRPHVCTYCNRRFKDKPVLQKHILIHTGEKPYACKICNKQFRQTSVLTLHMRTHTGETPYPCHLCSCKFKYSHHLQNHMKVHK